MKLLVALSSFLALCAAGVPNIPVDNSHYVEGVSRYVWMPDMDGNPQLVDLQAPVDAPPVPFESGDNNQYWLFTRKNPYNRNVLEMNNADSVRNSNYNSSLPLVVVVHGFLSNGEANVNHLIRNAYLMVGEYNIIAMDWSKSLNILYPLSVSAVKGVGEHLGKFLQWLIEEFDGDWDKVHLVGHSLGAHVVGNAGRTIGGKVARITGMDPAGPLFEGQSYAIKPDDGKYVECIHTDGHILGLYDPICQTNFYPNGGTNPQPGCLISTCSHSRSYELFAASIQYDRFVSLGCTDMDEMEDNYCNGDEVHMGTAALKKDAKSKIYRLNTESEYPY